MKREVRLKLYIVCLACLVFAFVLEIRKAIVSGASSGEIVGKTVVGVVFCVLSWVMFQWPEWAGSGSLAKTKEKWQGLSVKTARWGRLAAYVFLAAWVSVFAAEVATNGIAFGVWLQAVLAVGLTASCLGCLYRLWHDKRSCLPAILVACLAAFGLFLASALPPPERAVMAARAKQKQKIERMLEQYAKQHARPSNRGGVR